MGRSPAISASLSRISGIDCERQTLSSELRCVLTADSSPLVLSSPMLDYVLKRNQSSQPVQLVSGQLVPGVSGVSLCQNAPLSSSVKRAVR